MGLNDINSLSHSKWNCKYHIVFAPKYRRKVFYSVRSATTGSFLAAMPDGMSPAMNVRNMLIMTSAMPPTAGNIAFNALRPVR